MKPNILGIWLPLEIARHDWPDDLRVVKVLLQDDRGGSYMVECPDMKTAVNDLFMALNPTERREHPRPLPSGVPDVTDLPPAPSDQEGA